MFDIRLLPSLLQISLFPIAQAASPLSQVQTASTKLTETTNLTTANHASYSLPNTANDLSLFFTDLGGPIPADELRNTLFIASANVQTHLPHQAGELISKSLFEANISFPETGDNVYFWVHSYGFGLSWLQLSQALVIIQAYVFGLYPSHPPTHYHQLEFYIQPTTGVEVAHGAVDFKPGSRAVAKRNLATTTLQLPQLNLSSHLNTDLPIVFNIPRTNLDLNVTALGLPIPRDIVLDTIEAAFTDVIMNHPEIDYSVPFDKPYSFNITSGKRPQLFVTEIRVRPSFRKSLSWAVLCLVYYGLRDFMTDRSLFNVMTFEILDGEMGNIGLGEVLYERVV